MSFPEYFEKSFYVKGTDTSRSHTVFPSCMLGDMQETSEGGVLQYGMDTDSLLKNDFCWIILKMSVRMKRLPKWRETFKVRTWNAGVSGLFFRRSYYICDADDNVIGSADSLWIIADVNSHRPVRPKNILAMYDKPDMEISISAPQNDFELDFTIPSVSFPSDEVIGDSPLMSKYADYSEIDSNNHVNNTRYVSWALDALHKYGVNVDGIKDFDITYHAEVKESEKVDLYVYESEGFYYVVGLKQDSKVFIFRAS